MVMAEWHRNGFHKFFHVAGFGEKKPGEIRVLFLDKSFMTAAAMDRITRHQIIQYDFVVVTYDTVAGACKKGRYHEVNLELDPNYPTRILSVHPRQRAQSDDATVTGLGILFKTPWERVFADESTRFSNHSTKLYQYVMAIYGRFKYCLTGTPIVNKSLDLWSQLRFCGYSETPYAPGWKKRSRELMIEHGLNRYILIMDYENSEITLPPIHRVERRVVLDRENTAMYSYVKEMARRANDLVLAGAASYAGVLKMIMRLRQTCIAPYLMLGMQSKQVILNDDEAVNFTGVDEAGAEGVDAELQAFLQSGQLKEWAHDKYGTAGMKSPKCQEVINIVSRVPPGEKVIIFSVFTTALNLLGEALSGAAGDASDTVVQIDGQVSDKKRNAILRRFHTDPKCRVLLMTTRVGAFGLNLVEANHVIFLDIWWNKVAQDQAERRVYRPGQTRPVYSYTILSELPGQEGVEQPKTVEDRIQELCLTKHEMAVEMLTK
jgi:SNF2 family DNA or RNA helicase